MQTAQLDGERTLKPKLAPLDVCKNFSKIFSGDYKFTLSCVEPSQDIYFFFGNITVESTKFEASPMKEEMDLAQFLHRGATIRNSGKVLALVVYTGTDTKLIKNFGKYKFKRP